MKLRWYQREAIDALFRYWVENKGNPVIALPTGTGKSVVIAGFIKEALERYPGTRILVLTHVKELIGQNHAKLLDLWPAAPAGVNSAGLGRRDWHQQVIFAGIGSVAKGALKLGHRHIVLIDECHTVSPKEQTQYRKCLKLLASINPKIKIAGLTATPYRLGSGMIIEPGGVFTDICYDQTGLDEFNRFIDEGFLAPLIPKPMELHLDASGVSRTGGDYNLSELQKAVDKEHLTRKAVEEIIRYGGRRKHWLIFAAGVNHSDHVAAMFGEFGIPAVSIHSESEDGLREEGEAAFRSGEVRALVNNGIYTTGYDFSGIDLIGVLRNTVSPGLWVQMLGRGTRPTWPERDGSNWHLWPQGAVASGRYDLETIEGRLACIEEGPKRNCLVLDFARNTASLGPINAPRIPQKKGKKSGQPPPAKICPNALCRAYNHTSARFCSCCKTQFPENVKFGDEASGDEVIAKGRKRKEEPLIEEPQEELLRVNKVIFEKSYGSGFKRRTFKSPPALKVVYKCGVRDFSEYVNLEHSGHLGEKARQWWIEASSGLTVPQTVDEALGMVSQIKPVQMIRVWMNRHPSPQVQYRQFAS